MSAPPPPTRTHRTPAAPPLRCRCEPCHGVSRVLLLPALPVCRPAPAPTCPFVIAAEGGVADMAVAEHMHRTKLVRVVLGLGPAPGLGPGALGLARPCLCL